MARSKQTSIRDGQETSRARTFADKVHSMSRVQKSETAMMKYAYCLKKQQKIDDHKSVEYCITGGTHETVCKNFRLIKINRDGKTMLEIKTP